MTIFELGALGEFVGAILLFVSLIYVGLQIRQNTTATRMASIQAAVESSADFHKILISDEKINDVFYLGLAEPNSLGVEQRRKFISLLSIFMRRESLAYYLHKNGHMPADFWSARERMVSSVWNQPGTELFLDAMGDSLPTDFLNYLRDIISQPSTMSETTMSLMENPTHEKS